MDLNILIAALSLLVASLAEIRATWRDKSKDQVKPLGVLLLQLLFTLDRIIETGQKLINILASIPLKDETGLGTIGKKKEILSLVQEQRKNLAFFDEIYNLALYEFSPQNTPSVGSAIEFMISAKPIPPIKNKGKPIDDIDLEYLNNKTKFLDAIQWKLLDTGLSSSYLGVTARNLLKTFNNSIYINDSLGDLSFHFPVKIRVRIAKFTGGGEHIKIDEASFVEYDLKRQADIRNLLYQAQIQLKELKEYRQELAEFIQTSFSLIDLVKS
jgi:hypothetical protein